MKSEFTSNISVRFRLSIKKLEVIFRYTLSTKFLPNFCSIRCRQQLHVIRNKIGGLSKITCFHDIFFNFIS